MRQLAALSRGFVKLRHDVKLGQLVEAARLMLEPLVLV